VRLLLRRIRRADQELMRRASRARSPRLDRTLVAVTTTANNSGVWFVIAGLLGSLGGARERRAARAGVLAIVLASGVANGPAKLLVRRRRPAQHATLALIGMPPSTSFPSGHSASAFAFVTATSRELPALAPALVPLAGAVSYSRVHTGVHYPSDVVAGAAIGFGCGLLARFVGRSVRRARARRERPSHAR
jgi:membrane-associated phospholipid phosphatase